MAMRKSQRRNSHRGFAQARFELARARKVELNEAALAPILEAFELAARLDPESPEPEFGRGFALETAGNQDAARAAYRSALERDPEHVGSLLNLAASLADAGEAAKARALARRVLALGRGWRRRSGSGSRSSWRGGSGGGRMEAAGAKQIFLRNLRARPQGLRSR